MNACLVLHECMSSDLAFNVGPFHVCCVSSFPADPAFSVLLAFMGYGVSPGAAVQVSFVFK